MGHDSERNRQRTVRHLLVCAVLLLSACYRSRADIQRDYARDELAPRKLGAQDPLQRPAAPEEVRVYRVRAWADATYRTQTTRWEERIRALVERASEALAPEFGVRFQLVELHPWERASRDSPHIEDSLQALEAQDHGDEVDWVFGFIGARAFTNDRHDAGMARLGGRHLVLRGSERMAMLKHIDHLDALPQAERDALYAAGKKHSETVVLLHEWAHTLGVPHDATAGAIMCGQYEPQQRSFSQASVALIRVSLGFRKPQTPVDKKAWQRALLAAVDERSSEFTGDGCAQVRSWAKSANEVQPQTQLTPDEVDAANRVISQINSDKPEEARRDIERLTRAHPEHGLVRELACRVEVARDAKSASALAQCRQACRLGPSTTPCVLAVQGVGSVPLPLVGEMLDLAQDRLRGHGSERPKETLDLATTLAQLHRLAQAEQVAQQLGLLEDGMAIRQRIAVRRSWLGLPPGALTPEREPDFARAYHSARTGLAAAAPRALAELERDFAGVPGTLALRCEAALRRRQHPAGRKLCQAALAAWPETWQAHVLLAGLDLAQRHAVAAVDHATIVVEGDRSFETGWRLLAKALQAAHRPAEVAALRERYAAQFGHALTQEPK